MDEAPEPIPTSLSNCINLANTKFGSQIIFSTDEWFATANNLLKDEDPVFIEGKFTRFGKWMDGWESRRKRILGWVHIIIF